jgi:DNA-3-methyladenine glycosylase
MFERGPEIVARELLGKLVVRRAGKQELIGRIVETEAYLNDGDPAAHSFAGRTARTEVLFGPPGYAYVYFIYGMHYCLNVSCEPEGRAGAVLIRALEPVEGVARMRMNRGLEANARLRDVTGGPARLAEAYAVTRKRDNGKDMLSATSDLQLREDNFSAGKIVVSRRVGISKAVERPLRFYLDASECVSRR